MSQHPNLPYTKCPWQPHMAFPCGLHNEAKRASTPPRIYFKDCQHSSLAFVWSSDLALVFWTMGPLFFSIFLLLPQHTCQRILPQLFKVTHPPYAPFHLAIKHYCARHTLATSAVNNQEDKPSHSLACPISVPPSLQTHTHLFILLRYNAAVMLPRGPGRHGLGT